MKKAPRYQFGDNWARFAEDLSPEAIEAAEAGLREHVGDVEGCSFLDVGSGSGLMSAAALRLGARPLRAFDYDTESVVTTRRVLDRLAPGEPWETIRGDVLEDDFGVWDVVYAWGVLHHTGNVRTALQRAAGWVAPGGRYVVAIYARTPFCRLWALEKRWYISAPGWQKRLARWILSSARIAAWTLRGTNPVARLRSYGKRGMSFSADLDDWLGGYPYESMTLTEIEEVVQPLGFTVEERFPIRPTWGVLGSGCQTVRFRRIVE